MNVARQQVQGAERLTALIAVPSAALAVITVASAAAAAIALVCTEPLQRPLGLLRHSWPGQSWAIHATARNWCMLAVACGPLTRSWHRRRKYKPLPVRVAYAQVFLQVWSAQVRGQGVQAHIWWYQMASASLHRCNLAFLHHPRAQACNGVGTSAATRTVVIAVAGPVAAAAAPPTAVICGCMLLWGRCLGSPPLLQCVGEPAACMRTAETLGRGLKHGAAVREISACIGSAPCAP